jgi:hypothetical protein
VHFNLADGFEVKAGVGEVTRRFRFNLGRERRRRRPFYLHGGGRHGSGGESGSGGGNIEEGDDDGSGLCGDAKPELCPARWQADGIRNEKNILNQLGCMEHLGRNRFGPPKQNEDCF